VRKISTTEKSATIIPVILSGGSGTRLWPVSRKAYPKQLLSLTGSEHSMLQETALRVKNFGQPIVVANEDHRFLVAEQFHQLDQKADIILEPAGKNTAPAIALAACLASQKNADAILVVLPADHRIEKTAAFQRALKAAIAEAKKDLLVTFGIVPTHPETGYGYIRAAVAKKADVYPIAEFVEKPDLATAKCYLKSGKYFWNSGMFVFKAAVYLQELQKYAPLILKHCSAAFEKAQHDLDFIRVDKTAFMKSPEDSIDYAIMEKAIMEKAVTGETACAVMVPLDAGWSDLGSWSSVWDVMKKDKNKNVIVGDVIAQDCRNSLFFAEDHLIAAIGVDDLVVVDTSDALLISRQDRVQEVKKIVDHIKRSKRSEHLTHRRVYRPWGSYEGIGEGQRYQVKRIIVKPGASLSLQMHHQRAEHWVVVAGTARVQRGDEELLLQENESIYIPLGEKHRLSNPGKQPLELIEVQSGAYLGEDDIVRFEDHYGRHK
jgi:mannose-1-phosphate guanylyltransferase/mannose-6-phosphate isomerase